MECNKIIICLSEGKSYLTSDDKIESGDSYVFSEDGINWNFAKCWFGEFYGNLGIHTLELLNPYIIRRKVICV